MNQVGSEDAETTVITYDYDDLYGLTDAVYTGAITGTYEYVYDSVGNMTAFTETVDRLTTVVTRTFDTANRLQTALDLDEGTTSYVYDDNGNLTDIYPPGSDGQNPVGVLHYDYNQRNLLITHTTYVSGTGWVVQAEYVYDGNDDRLQQVDHTGATPVTTTYTNDVFGLTQVLVADDGTEQVYNLFGLDLIQQDDDSIVQTLLVDGLGSVRLEAAGGTIAAVTTYSPYGEMMSQSGTSGTVYGFTGEQEDSATGLLYLRARYYNSSLKVFQSRDSWEGSGWRPSTLNYYTYGLNNPVKYKDPSGHVVCEGRPERCDPIGSYFRERLSFWDPFRYTVSEPRVATPTSSNVTGWLINLIVDVAPGPVVKDLYKNNVIWSDPVHQYAAGQAWVALVRTGAIWDFKPDLIAAGVARGQDRLVNLGNRDVNYQAVANIFYGFIGRASGFTEWELLLGAGAAQIKDHGFVWENFNLAQLGDQAFDAWSIRFGFYLFELYGWDLNIFEWEELYLLDEEAFSQALDDYIQEYGEPPDLPTP